MDIQKELQENKYKENNKYKEDNKDNKNKTQDNKKKSEKLTAGFGICGSFCTFSKILPIIGDLSKEWNIIPIFSENAANIDTRFAAAADFEKEVEKITDNKPINNIKDAEPIGPKKLLDVLVIAPCTGNTAAKIAGGIADTPVTLAVKSQLRNNRPVIIGISTNDGLGANAVNIGKLMTRKNIYLVPFGQDDFVNKENSLVADFSLIKNTVESALKGKQLQPILI